MGKRLIEHVIAKDVQRIAVDPVTNLVYVTNSNDTISIIYDKMCIFRY